LRGWLPGESFRFRRAWHRVRGNCKSPQQPLFQTFCRTGWYLHPCLDIIVPYGGRESWLYGLAVVKSLNTSAASENQEIVEGLKPRHGEMVVSFPMLLDGIGLGHGSRTRMPSRVQVLCDDKSCWQRQYANRGLRLFERIIQTLNGVSPTVAAVATSRLASRASLSARPHQS
jgi:hypothetical protein